MQLQRDYILWLSKSPQNIPPSSLQWNTHCSGWSDCLACTPRESPSLLHDNCRLLTKESHVHVHDHNKPGSQKGVMFSLKEKLKCSWTQPIIVTLDSTTEIPKAPPVQQRMFWVKLPYLHSPWRLRCALCHKLWPQSRCKCGRQRAWCTCRPSWLGAAEKHGYIKHNNIIMHFPLSAHTYTCTSALSNQYACTLHVRLPFLAPSEY